METVFKENQLFENFLFCFVFSGCCCLLTFDLKKTTTHFGTGMYQFSECFVLWSLRFYTGVFAQSHRAV